MSNVSIPELRRTIVHRVLDAMVHDGVFLRRGEFFFHGSDGGCCLLGAVTYRGRNPKYDDDNGAGYWSEAAEALGIDDWELRTLERGFEAKCPSSYADFRHQEMWMLGYELAKTYDV